MVQCGVQIDRKMRRLVSKQNIPIQQFKNNLCINLSKATYTDVYLKKTVFKNPCKPRRKTHHKQTRIEWAWTYMSYEDNWLNVLFSDKKKWNLYWMVLMAVIATGMTLHKYIPRRRQDGKSMLVWKAIHFNC